MPNLPMPFDSNGAGVAIADLDGDGWLDVLLGGLHGPATVLWNRGGPGGPAFDAAALELVGARAVAIVDVDGDGHQDIVATRPDERPRWLRRSGARTFRIVDDERFNLATMLLAGEIDAAIGPGPVDSPDIQPLFPDARQADDAWHRKTGIYPISHLLVVKDAALAGHAGLATELFRLFNEAKSQYLPRLRFGAAEDAGDRSLREMAQTVGGAPLPFGFESSRRTLETFIRFNVEQSVMRMLRTHADQDS